MTYEKAKVEVTLFDKKLEFMAESTGACNPVGNTSVVCTGGFSCESIGDGGNHKFTCGGYDASKYDAKPVGGSGKYECNPVTCTSYRP